MKIVLWVHRSALSDRSINSFSKNRHYQHPALTRRCQVEHGERQEFWLCPSAPLPQSRESPAAKEYRLQLRAWLVWSWPCETNPPTHLVMIECIWGFVSTFSVLVYCKFCLNKHGWWWISSNQYSRAGCEWQWDGHISHTSICAIIFRKDGIPWWGVAMWYRVEIMYIMYFNVSTSVCKLYVYIYK